MKERLSRREFLRFGLQAGVTVVAGETIFGNKDYTNEVINYTSKNLENQGLNVSFRGFELASEYRDYIDSIYSQDDNPAQITANILRKVALEKGGDENTEGVFLERIVNLSGSLVAGQGMVELQRHGAISRKTYLNILMLTGIAYALSPTKKEEITHNLNDGVEGFSLILGTTYASKLIRLSEDENGFKSTVDSIIKDTKVDRQQKLRQLIILANTIGISLTTIVNSSVIKKLAEDLATDPDSQQLDKRVMSAMQGFIPNNSGGVGIGPFIGGDFGPRLAAAQEVGKENLDKITENALPIHLIHNFSFISEVLRLIDGEKKGRTDTLKFILDFKGWTDAIRTIKERGFSFAIWENTGQRAKDFSKLVSESLNPGEISDREEIDRFIEGIMNLADITNALPEENGESPSEQVTVERQLASAIRRLGEPGQYTRLGHILAQLNEIASQRRSETIPIPQLPEGVLKIQEVVKNIFNLHNLGEVFDHDMAEIAHVFPFQALSIPFIEGTIKDTLNGVENELKRLSLSERASEEAIYGASFSLFSAMSSTFDNFAAFKACYKVLRSRVENRIKKGKLTLEEGEKEHMKVAMLSYWASIVGGGFLPPGNMPNLVLFSLGKYSMSDAGKNIGKRVIPDIISYLTTQLQALSPQQLPFFGLNRLPFNKEETEESH